MGTWKTRRLDDVVENIGSRGLDQLLIYAIKLAQINAVSKSDYSLMQKGDDLLREALLVVRKLPSKYFSVKLNSFSRLSEGYFSESADNAHRIILSSVSAVCDLYSPMPAYDLSHVIPTCVDFVITYCSHIDFNSIYNLQNSMYNHGKVLEDRYKTPDAISLARSIKKTYDFSAMPILADALEEAGLEDDSILRTMRNKPEYWTEGAWAVYELTN